MLVLQLMISFSHIHILDWFSLFVKLTLVSTQELLLFWTIVLIGIACACCFGHSIRQLFWVSIAWTKELLTKLIVKVYFNQSGLRFSLTCSKCQHKRYATNCFQVIAFRLLDARHYTLLSLIILCCWSYLFLL